MGYNVTVMTATSQSACWHRQLLTVICHIHALSPKDPVRKLKAD